MSCDPTGALKHACSPAEETVIGAEQASTCGYEAMRSTTKASEGAKRGEAGDARAYAASDAERGRSNIIHAEGERTREEDRNVDYPQNALLEGGERGHDAARNAAKATSASTQDPMRSTRPIVRPTKRVVRSACEA
jgi:hypothetical protein